MAWIYVVLAGIVEIGWAAGLKYSEGFTRPGASIVTVVLMAISFVLLSLALKTLPIGTAYAIWTGIGAAGTALVGMLLFGDSAAPARLLCLAMIVAGVVGLKLVSPH